MSNCELARRVWEHKIKASPGSPNSTLSTARKVEALTRRGRNGCAEDAEGDRLAFAAFA